MPELPGLCLRSLLLEASYPSRIVSYLKLSRHPLQVQFYVFEMEGPITYLPSADGPKLISKPVERMSLPRNFFCHFLRSKGKASPTPVKPATRFSERKAILKPILLRQNGNMDPRIDAAPYLWPHDSTFNPKTTALVIIDMQKDCKSILQTSCSA